MPSSTWLLYVDGIGTRTLADWGLSDCVLDRGSLRPGIFTANAAAADGTAAPICAFGTAIILYDHLGVVRFKGTRVAHRSIFGGSAEAKSYTFADAWYNLQRRVFHQIWNTYVGGVLTQAQTSHLLLNYSLTTGILSIGDMITAVINYAQTQGVAIQAGNISIPAKPPVRETLGQQCAPLIIDQLKWAPDAVVWIDYSFDPPAFHCQQPSETDIVTLPVLALASIISKIEVQAQEEAVVPGINLQFEKYDTINGEQKRVLEIDAYPVGTTGREENALSQCINLQGYNATVVNASITAALLDYTNLEWWKGQTKYSWLNDPNIRVSAVATPINGHPTSARTGTLNLENYLVDGQVADWMEFQSEHIEVQIIVKVELYAGASTLDLDEATNVFEKVLTLSVVSTDAPVGQSDVSQIQSFEEGDPTPVGLARSLYGSLSRTEYFGGLTITELECSGAINLGQRLNLTGGAAAWQAMEARVQAIVEHIDTGETFLTLGPSPTRSVDAIIELLHANYIRRRWTSAHSQETGEISGNGVVELGDKVANINSIPGPEIHRFFAAKYGDYKLSLDAVGPDGFTPAGAGAGTPGTFLMEAPVNMGEINLKTNGDGLIEIQTLATGGRRHYIHVIPYCPPSGHAGETWGISILASDPFRIS